MPDSSSSMPASLISQLICGPSLREVATDVLKDELKRLYPQLHIDPDRAMVVTPIWEVINNQVVHGNPLLESLTDVLVRLSLTLTTVTFLDGEHFLTRHPGNEPMLQMPVRIDVIGRRLNELARLMFTVLQEKNLDYWNAPAGPDTPRWRRFSEALRKLWDVGQPAGWDADQCAMAGLLYHYPDLAQRLPNDKYLSRAYLIDLDMAHQGTTEHLVTLDCAVLIGTVGKRSLILTQSLTRGLQRFDSLEALGQSLNFPSYLVRPGWILQWRLFEPEGDFFDDLACSLIALENTTIGDSAPTQTTLAGAPPDSFNGEQTLQPANFNWVQSLLPTWLEKASTPDISRYSRHLLDLTQVRNQAQGKSFCDDIPPLAEFAQQALRKQLEVDHPDAKVHLDDIEIEITSLQVWGTFIVPGATDTLTMSLVELALQNLIALPLGNKVLREKKARDLPEWMTVSYVEQLVRTVDIGATYPALIKGKLLDDPVQAAEREHLYTQHLRVELPLQALQLKIRGQAGINETGYRFVCAAMETDSEARWVDGLEIVIKPLAFAVAGTADEVANMYVIGPRYAGNQPCLLYRPLLDHSLLQYASETNLLYAIKHSWELRQSILAWLPKTARFNYSQYIFAHGLPSPWTLPQLLSDPTTALLSTATIGLGDTPLAGDVLASLFKANARAMAELADRQSVSNAESRWASLQLGAWRIFSMALPFLGRTVGIAAWIWQIMDDLQQVSDAQQENDSQAQWAAVTDLLLNLGMVLAHRVATRAKDATPLWERPRLEPLPTISANVQTRQLPEIDTLPAGHGSSLYTYGVAGRSRLGLGHFLDGIKVDKPEMLEQVTEPGTHQHLYQHQSAYYANVGQRWFEVRVTDNDDVQVINSSSQPLRTGPLLTHNAQGEWFIDLRLRLRGGGRRSRMKAMQARKATEIVELTEKVNQFNKASSARFESLKTEAADVKEASTETIEAKRSAFLEHLTTYRDEYQTAIDQLRALSLKETVDNYQYRQISLLRDQLFLNQTWLDQTYAELTRNLEKTAEHLQREIWPIDTATRQTYKALSAQVEGAIEKIEFAQARFEILGRLGKGATKLKQEYLARLPTISVNDLKQFLIEISQHLSFKEESQLDWNGAPNVLDWILFRACLSINGALELAIEDDQLLLNERIDALSAIVEQLEASNQRLKDFQQEFSQHLQEPPMALIRKCLDEFSRGAENNLASLLLEQKSLEPPKPRASTSTWTKRKKVIHTRFQGTLVGQARADNASVVEIVAPLTGKTSTFHEKTPGDWVEEVAPPPIVKAPKGSLKNHVKAGQAMVDNVERFILDTRARVLEPQSIPAEVEDLFRSEARRLLHQIDAIEQHLESTDARTPLRTQAVTLNRQLREAADRLYAQGTQARTDTIKNQPPVASRVEWLDRHNEIYIVREGGREQLKGHRNDFLQQFQIRDRGTQELLWYAHFHYSAAKGPIRDFTVAHLKTLAQARLGGKFDLRAASSNRELIEIHRAAISRELANALFFS